MNEFRLRNPASPSERGRFAKDLDQDFVLGESVVRAMLEVEFKARPLAKRLQISKKGRGYNDRITTHAFEHQYPVLIARNHGRGHG